MENVFDLSITSNVKKNFFSLTDSHRNVNGSTSFSFIFSGTKHCCDKHYICWQYSSESYPKMEPQPPYIPRFFAIEQLPFPYPLLNQCEMAVSGVPEETPI